MEAQRIRNIINIYSELKNQKEKFKDIEPSFIEGDENLIRQITDQNIEEAGEPTPPPPIEQPTTDGGTQTGTDTGTDTGGTDTGGTDTGGTDDGGTDDGGTDDGGTDDGGTDDGGTDDGGGDDGGDDHDPNAPPPPPPPTPPPPTPTPEPEPPEDYTMKFPFLTEMFYGKKICNNSSEEETKIIENKIYAGCGIAICRALISESSKVGDTILSAKKQAYKQIFENLLFLVTNRAFYDADGKINLSVENIANAGIGMGGAGGGTAIMNIGGDIDGNMDVDIGELDNEMQNAINQYRKRIILADKLLFKSLPNLIIFNRDLFNKNQVQSIIKFCLDVFYEEDSMLVTDAYADDTLPSAWGYIKVSSDAINTYKYIYYKYKATYGANSKKEFYRVNCTDVKNGITEYVADYESVGDELYDFVNTVINNYINSSTQDFVRQTYTYRKTKENILQYSTSIFQETLRYIDRML